MSLDVLFNPPTTQQLRDELETMWVDVTNAGGAVGFVPTVTRDDIAPAAHKTWDEVSAGREHLVVGFDRQPIGWLTLLSNHSPLTPHWMTVVKFQIRPDQQGRGTGRELLEATHAFAKRELMLEQLRLSCRSGLGLETFYSKLGYVETGRNTRGVKLPSGEYRDEIFMAVELTQT